MDDVFLIVGVENAEAYVKALLNLKEWPPAEHDRVVVLVVSSEGVTRERVGRHSWASFKVMWNMPRSGFEQLYDVLPSPKPPFDEVWRLKGGNPRCLENFYKAGWDVEEVVAALGSGKRLWDSHTLCLTWRGRFLGRLSKTQTSS